jgi:hypothetical protein
MKIFFEDKYFLSALTIAGAFLYFFNLDNYYLGLDQGDYLIHAIHILEYGVPYILGDTPPFFDSRFAVDGVWGYHPWLGMYLIAGSVALFGQTTLGGVFPSAMCGLLSIFAIYYLAYQIHKNIYISRLSALFFTFSVPYILYMRTSRYFGPSILFGILTLIFFIRLWKNNEEHIYLFCISSVLLFYSMYSQFFGLFAGLTLFCVFTIRNKKFYKKIILSYCIIVGLTLPWFIKYFLPVRKKVKEFYSNYFNKDYEKNTGTIIEFIVGYLSQINSYIFPFILIVTIYLLKKYNSRFDWNWDKFKVLFCLCVGCSILVATLHTIPLFNYILGTVSIWAIFLAEIVYKLSKVNFLLASTTTVILLFTNWLHITPWFLYDKIFFPKIVAEKINLKILSSGLFKRWDASIRGTNKPYYLFWNYGQELSGDYNGALKEITNYLKTHGTPKDTFVVAHEGDSLSYYTGMNWGNIFPFNSPPKWIIPRNNRLFSIRGKQSSNEEKKQATNYVKNYLETHSYKKITLTSCDAGFENSYNIQNHYFVRCQYPDPKAVIYEYVGNGKNNSPE